MAQRKKTSKSATSKAKKVTYKTKSSPRKKTIPKVNDKKMQALSIGLDKLNNNFECLIGECKKALDTLLEPVQNTNFQIN